MVHLGKSLPADLNHHHQQRPKILFHSSAACINSMWLRVLLLLVLSTVAVSQSIIETLPGFSGKLPFKLETGYVGVGESDDVQLFYYFIESERNPKQDPLVLWLTGGPGCSAFSGLVYEIGPLSFNVADFDENLPTFKLNPYSWTKVASIIFLDAPVGTGFSYARNWESYDIGDKVSAEQTYTFLKKWLIDHPKFISKPLYVGGDSYSGIIVPIIVQEIFNGNEAGHVPLLKLKGYLLGNPLTDQHNDPNSRVEFAHRVTLISDELYESTKRSCNGEYVNVDPNNVQCEKDLQVVTQCIEKIDIAQILEPGCSLVSPKSMQIKWDRRFLEENSTDFLISPPQRPELWCRVYNYMLSYIWASDRSVQNALHIRPGTIKDWVRCNKSLSYTYDVLSSVDYHRNLTKTSYRALIYSGDHDMAIPYVGTQEWIRSLNLSIIDDWKPWFVDGQVAGFSMKYSKKGYHMTFATVKGGGHTAPEYKPKECLEMIDRWFSYYPL